MRTRIDRYQIKHEIGHGGMATVYCGYDPRVKRDVAIKVLQAPLTADPQFRARFEREATIIAGLDHPAIVPIYDFGEDGGEMYIVMRYMGGGSLSQRLRKRGALPLTEAAAVVERVASALDLAHARGIVHRDLKPGNILFDQYGSAYLSDFGIVKVLHADPRTETDPLVGTPAYMSPEQVEGSIELDGRSDVYSLTVILYEMLVGRAPYSSQTPLSLAVKHVREPVPRIRAAAPHLPAGIERVIERGMAKRRDERYPTAGDLARDLLPIAGAGASVPAHRRDTPTRPGASTRPPSPRSDGPVVKIGGRKDPAPPPRKPPPPHAPPPLRTPSPRRGTRLPLWVGLLVGLILIGAAVLQLRGWGRSAAATPEAPLTRTPGPTLAPTLTDAASREPALVVETPATVSGPPREGRIVFVAGDEFDAALDVFTMPAGGGPTARLTFDAANYRTPRWSPDGTQIVFRAERSGVRIIYRMNADGSDVRALTDAASDNYAPAWSPDGTQIVFVSERDGNPEIYLMNADGSSPRRLTDNNDADFFPSWSPDGTRIVFNSNLVFEGGQDIYIMSASGSTPGRLTYVPEFDYAAVWSPDGSRIAFVSERDGNAEIYVMNADGSNQRRLTNDTAADLSPSWSPDGERILFSSRRDGVADLYVVSADGGPVTRLTETEVAELDPDWQR